MTTYNQYQVFEIKSSYISSIHSQPTTPTAHTHTHTQLSKRKTINPIYRKKSHQNMKSIPSGINFQ